MSSTDLAHKYGHPGVKKYKKELIAKVMNKPVKKASTTVAPAKKPEKKVEKFDKKVDKFFGKVAKLFD